MRRGLVVAILMAVVLAGCATAAQYDAAHPPDFVPIPGMPDLPLGIYALPGVTITVVGDFPVRCSDPAQLYRGCYRYRPGKIPFISSNGTAENIGHEMAHYCRHVGWDTCAPAVEALRAVRR